MFVPLFFQIYMGKFIFITIILLFAVLLNKKRKGGWSNPSTLLLLLYLGSSIACIPVVYYNITVAAEDYRYAMQPDMWPGAIAYLLFLFLFLSPFCFFNESKIQKIVLPNLRVLNIVSTVLIILSVFSLVYNFRSVITVFSSGDLNAARLSVAAGNRSDYVESGLLNTISSVSASLYSFVLLLFFIYYIIGGHKVRTLLLLISSTSNIVYVLTFVGRDGVVFWLFNMLFFLFFFKDYLRKKQLKALRVGLSFMALIALLPFLLISVSRFSSRIAGTGGGMVSYFGQAPANYVMYYRVADKHYSYGVSFPLYWEITRQKPPQNEDRWIEGGTESNVFASFIKGFNTNFGMAGTVVVGLIAFAIFMIVFGKRKNSFYFYYFSLYVLYWSVYSEGVFYFKQNTRGGNLFIILCFVFFIFFKLVQSNGGNLVLLKPND